MKESQPGKLTEEPINLQDTPFANATANPLGHEPIGVLLIRFAIPAIIAMLVNALYNVVDQIFIGQGVGYLGMGATTVSMPLTTISIAITVLIGMGGSALSAIKLGERKRDEAERILGTSFTSLALLSIAVAILFSIFIEPLLGLFGATPSIMPYAREYALIINIGLPFSALANGMSHFIRNAGSPRVAMLSQVAGAVLNCILDPLFIFVFHWGVGGAAIATVISQIVSCSIVVWYLMNKGEQMRLHVRHLKPNSKLFLAISAMGIPGFLMQSASVLMQLISNNSLVTYGNQTEYGGDIALSAMGVSLRINFIAICLLLGLHQGAQPIIGYNKGAGRPDRVKKAYILTVTIASVVAVLAWLVMRLAPEAILSIFGNGTPKFNEFAVRCLRIFLFGMFGSGFQIISANYFQASGQPLKSTLLSSSRQLLLLAPLTLILPLFFGLDGVLYAGPVSDIIALLLTGVFIFREMHKLDREIMQMHSSTNTLEGA